MNNPDLHTALLFLMIKLKDYKQQCGEDYLAGKRTYPIEQVHTWLAQILNDIKLPTTLGI